MASVTFQARYLGS